PHQPFFTRSGNLGLVESQGPGELTLINPANNTVGGALAVGKLPHWVATSSDGRLAYVTNEGSNDVSVVDLEARKLSATIPVGNAPRKIALQPGAINAAAAPASGSSAGGPAAQGGGQTLKLGAFSFADHGTQDATGKAQLDLEADDYYFGPTFVRG